jgi:mRNA-degrading endonuclease toxin of MazEF toxin-antitoxin module
MSKLKLKRPSLGTVLGFTALVVAVVGNANASPTHVVVKRGDLAPGAVTAKAIAPGAVTSKKLAKGAVTAKKLGKGAVRAAAIGPDAVTAAAIAPGSVYGGALGETTVHTAPMADLDQVAANPEWTSGNSQPVACAPGEKLLGGGFGFTNPGNREATFLQMLPSPSANGVLGLMATNSGGTAAGEIVALCLK